MKKVLFLWIAIFQLTLFYSCEKLPENEVADTIYAVTDLSHEFTFYADHRFHKQYLPDHIGVTNWCNLYNFDFSNANLLILLGCDNRITYTDQDINTIDDFLKKGGGVVIFGSVNAHSQNDLISNYGAVFNDKAEYPLKLTSKVSAVDIEGEGVDILDFNNASAWDVLLKDSNNKSVMARKRVGKGTLLLSSRSLAGSHPSARDSINKDLWRALLPEIAGGKEVDVNEGIEGAGIDDLEYSEDHETFELVYNDYLKPYAADMVDIYQRSLPHIENRMGVPLEPGMASKIALLATGGGGFSSGEVIGLAVWWGGFPEKEDSMIEFLTHESVHSWVLPFPEVWNEPIATYVGNLVMIDMGHEQEALKRISNTTNRALGLDPQMDKYDIYGNLTGNGRELNDNEKNNIHWGKTYWVFEQLRKENPDFIADYFKVKRQVATEEKISSYDMNNTVAVISMAMGKNMFDWFNAHGMPVNEDEAEIKVEI